MTRLDDSKQIVTIVERDIGFEAGVSLAYDVTSFQGERQKHFSIGKTSANNGN